MARWKQLELEQHFRSEATRKRGDAERCRFEVRAGKRGNRHFYDRLVAEEMVATILSTAAALESRDLSLDRLHELRGSMTDRFPYPDDVYDREVFRKAWVEYVDELLILFTNSSEMPDLRYT